jgi:hypothetical protein
VKNQLSSLDPSGRRRLLQLLLLWPAKSSFRKQPTEKSPRQPHWLLSFAQPKKRAQSVPYSQLLPTQPPIYSQEEDENEETTDTTNHEEDSNEPAFF